MAVHSFHVFFVLFLNIFMLVSKIMYTNLIQAYQKYWRLDLNWYPDIYPVNGYPDSGW